MRAELSGQDSWSPPFDGNAAVGVLAKNPRGLVNLSIWGTWVGKLSLQRRFSDDEPDEWRTTDVFTKAYEGTFVASPSADYRIGFAPGDFTSGTAHVRIAI